MVEDLVIRTPIDLTQRPTVSLPLTTSCEYVTLYSESIWRYRRLINYVNEFDLYTMYLPRLEYEEVTLRFTDWLTDNDGFFLDNPEKFLKETLGEIIRIKEFYYNNLHNLNSIVTNNIRSLRLMMVTLETIEKLKP